MNKWESTTLGEVMTLQRGFDLPIQNRDNGNIPIIASTGIAGYHNVAMVKGPGVVIGRSGSIGGGQYIEQDFWPLNTTLWVKDFKGNHPRYCYYLLKSLDFSGYNVGSGVPTLNRNHIYPTPVSKPPLDAQLAIAHILGSLDDKIELNHKMNETLEAIAKAIFKSWFVDFDPVHAKMAGKKPVGMDETTAALFPASFEDSSLGQIPKGWLIGEASNHFNITMGQSPPGESYNEEDIGMLFHQGCTDFGWRFPSSRMYCTAPKRFAKKHDTLVSVRAPVGEINMASEDLCIGRGLSAIRHKLGCPSFTYYSMANLRSSFENYEANGTVFGCIGKNDFDTLKVIVPKEEVIKAFSDNITTLDCLIYNNYQEILNLTDIRDLLLPKLISGEIKIKE